MKVNGIRCKLCDDIVYARESYSDVKFCSCGNILVGGSWCIPSVQNKTDLNTYEIIRKISIKATSNELYDDFVKNINKFGFKNYNSLRRFKIKKEVPLATEVQPQ